MRSPNLLNDPIEQITTHTLDGAASRAALVRAAESMDTPPLLPCMDTSSQRVAAALSRMQERDGLRSRAG